MCSNIGPSRKKRRGSRVLSWVRKITADGGSKPGVGGYVILDVGAGTTDIAGFYCVNNPEWDRPRIFEVRGAADAIKSAGNILDSALIKLVLNKANVMPGSAEYQAAAAYLN